MRVNLSSPTVSFGSNSSAAKAVSSVEYGAARLIHKIAHTDTMKKLTEYANKESTAVNLSGKNINNFDNVIRKHMPAVLALWIAGFYVINNLKSDIPKERKVPLLINDILTASFATIAGYTIVNGFKAFQFGLEEKLVKAMPLKSFIQTVSDKARNAQDVGKVVVKNLDDLLNLAKDKEFVGKILKQVADALKAAPKNADKALILDSAAKNIANKFGANNKVVENFVKLAQGHSEKITTLKGGIGLMMGLFAFTFVFRYLGPVIATPVADKVNKFLIKHNIIKDPNVKPQDKKPIADSSQLKAPQGAIVPQLTSNSDYLTVLDQYFKANNIK